jgi:hypothetical protein
LRSVSDALTGAVAATQRTDSALRLNVHYHVLALDGVYVRDESGTLIFHALPTPTHEEVALVAARTAARVERLLQKRGRTLEDEAGDEGLQPELAFDEPGLAACYSAAAQGITITGDRAGQPLLRLITSRQPPAPPPDDAPVAEVRGINLHAKQCVDGRDRRLLERLCRYITRPPVAQDRLERRSDGTLELSFKSVWKDGSRGVVLEPHDLLLRLVAAVPPPRAHLLNYYGVLSSHCAHRAEVVPKSRPEPGQHAPLPAVGDQLELLGDDDGDEQPVRRNRWGWLLKRVFRAEVDRCPKCDGPMRWVEAARTPEAAADLLGRLGLAPRPPPAAPLQPLGQLTLGFRSDS